jgi:hypothetical protein
VETATINADSLRLQFPKTATELTSGIPELSIAQRGQKSPATAVIPSLHPKYHPSCSSLDGSNPGIDIFARLGSVIALNIDVSHRSAFI